jgi:hypothetical protein
MLQALEALAARYASVARVGPRLAICGFVVVAGSISLSALDALLGSMHPVGAAHYGMGDLAPLFGGHAASDVVATWQAWLDAAKAAARGAAGVPGMAPGAARLVAGPGVPAGPDSIAAWYLAIDVVFAFAYTTFAAALLAWLRDRFAAAHAA